MNITFYHWTFNCYVNNDYNHTDTFCIFIVLTYLLYHVIHCYFDITNFTFFIKLNWKKNVFQILCLCCFFFFAFFYPTALWIWFSPVDLFFYHTALWIFIVVLYKFILENSSSQFTLHWHIKWSVMLNESSAAFIFIKFWFVRKYMYVYDHGRIQFYT